MNRVTLGVLQVSVGLVWALSVAPAVAGGIYLVQGVGAERLLEVNKPAPKTSKALGGGWYRAGELEFKTDDGSMGGRVVLIRCRSQQCLTDRGIKIGSPESLVLQRHGAPLERSAADGGVLMRYRGVGFLLKQEQVTALYVLPP